MAVKKMKRSARLADMMQYLLTRPHQLIPLTVFSDRYQAAKSSISEDLQIIKDTLQMNGTGHLMTLPGAHGGVKYIPSVDLKQLEGWVEELRNGLEDPDRLLPGGYLYMSDYLGHPEVVNQIGRIFSSQFKDEKIDYVLTVETKGIPLAYATSQFLNVPFVIVRREHRVTEGSVVSINYISGSSRRIQTMSLARRSMRSQSRVLIVDDFMKAGGTIQGMIHLVEEFDSEVVGACVFVEAASPKEKLVDNVYSVLRLDNVDMEQGTIAVHLGRFFDQPSG